jgi:hypothetical protein
MQGHTVFTVDNGMLHLVDESRDDARDRPAIRADHEVGGALMPHLTDHHTHLGLTDPAGLFANGITDAVDLGWIPEVASTWLTDHPGHPAVRIAGALITAPGGYPTNAGWAPPGSAAEAGNAVEATKAVRRQVMLGASRIKVALNTDAGPSVDNSTLTAIVEEAHDAGVPVTIHAQGIGQVVLAVNAGADQLAHAPFSERLDDDLLRRAADAGMSWVSTLDIHGWGRPTPEFAIAVDNMRRFASAGGRIHYGTDLGNGPLPVGVNERELNALATAGLNDEHLLRAIAGEVGRTGASVSVGPRFAWIPTPPPERQDDGAAARNLAAPSGLPAWLATARGHTTTTILGART